MLESCNSDSSLKEKPFVRRSEVVGWANIHGTSRPVSGIVVGIEEREVLRSGNLQLVEEDIYIQVTGNKNPLLCIPNSRLHQGWTGEEVVITREGKTRELPDELLHESQMSQTAIELVPQKVKLLSV